MTSKEKLIEKLGLTETQFNPVEVTQLDRIEAQALYTALITDTIINEV